MSEPHANAYRELRLRVREIVRAADRVRVVRPAPATPDWSAHDLVAHLVGVPDDVVNGRIDGVASDPWTQAQVDKHAGAPPPRCWRSGNEPAPRVRSDARRPRPAEIAGQALFDAVTHEHDLRHAAGVAGVRDTEAVTQGWEWVVDAARWCPCVALRDRRREQVSGTGEIVAHDRGSPFRASPRGVRPTSGRGDRAVQVGS